MTKISSHTKDIKALVRVSAAAFVVNTAIVLLWFIDTRYTLTQVISFCCFEALFLTVLGMYISISQFRSNMQLNKLLATYSTVSLSLLLLFITGYRLNEFAIPLALSTLCIGLFANSRNGFIANLLVVVTYLFAIVIFDKDLNYTNVFYVISYGVICSVIGGAIAGKQRRRIEYILSMLIFSLAAVVCYIISIFAVEGALNKSIWINLLYAAISGVFNVALFFIIVPLFERIFNLVTDFRLAELTSTDQPLLKKLFKLAPGTFNHSLLVANYCEACASAIGADAYLAKACAYYHDIGKMRAPLYFKENQTDDVNIHNELPPEISVSFLKQHITNGVVLAKEYKLPAEITQAIIEHHGTMVIKYFYHKAKQFTDGELSTTEFNYSGNIPSTKITAILMIADACEAALRVLSSSEKDKADSVVANIISERLEQGQFDDCDITMKELSIIRQTITSAYIGISHERIVYPELTKN